MAQRKNFAAQLKTVFKTLDGITAELVEEASKNIAYQIHGEAQQHIPVDTEHMMKNTDKPVRNSQGSYSLITRAAYAERQYFGNLLHLWDGSYHSIREASIPLNTEVREAIKTAKFGEMGLEGYAQKYRLLKKAGKLTRRRGLWFDRAAKSIQKIDLQDLRSDFVRIARAKAEGKLPDVYRRRYIPLKR